MVSLIYIYKSNKMATGWCACMFDQVLDQTANKLLVKS